MNRHERKTTGKRLAKRLQTLKASPILAEMNLKDIPQVTIDALILGCCKNSALQKRYELQKRIFSEMTEIEIMLLNANLDLEKKLLASKKNLRNVQKA